MPPDGTVTIFDALLESPEQISVVLLLVLAVVSFLRGWIVPGSQFERILKERNEFKDLAWKALDLSKRTVETVSKDPAP